MNSSLEDTTMITGDGSYIKQINRGLILREIYKNKAISRASLANITGLNKATISVQVADLLKESLITEYELPHNTVGRKPIMLSINRKAGYVLGIDLDYKQIQFMISDLNGQPVFSESIALGDETYSDIVQLLIDYIQKSQKQWSHAHYGLISVVIGIHGTVGNDQQINFVPKYQWHHKKLKADLEKQVSIQIIIENNANLSAYAEKVYKHHDSQNLVAIILTSGIGSGMMINGHLQKGFHGFAGEMGHMIIAPDGKKCRCGNHGCWELYASESSLIDQLSKQMHNPHLTANKIIELIKQSDQHVLLAVEDLIYYLSIGLNNIINLYNPETLIITSEILKAYPNAISKIKKNLTSSVSQYRDIFISDLSHTSTTMGACALAIQHFSNVPQFILPDHSHHIE